MNQCIEWLKSKNYKTIDITILINESNYEKYSMLAQKHKDIVLYFKREKQSEALFKKCNCQKEINYCFFNNDDNIFMTINDEFNNVLKRKLYYFLNITSNIDLTENEKNDINMRKGIYIPVNGLPYSINYNQKIDKFSSILKTSESDHRSISWLDNLGYKLIIFCKDIADVETVNVLASIIGNTPMVDDCLLVDDDLDLDVDEFNKIFNISKNFDFVKYEKESNERFDKFMKFMKNNN
jgi:hypothetical protein